MELILLITLNMVLQSKLFIVTNREPTKTNGDTVGLGFLFGVGSFIIENVSLSIKLE